MLAPFDPAFIVVAHLDPREVALPPPRASVDQTQSDKLPVVVAIGASADGINALQAHFSLLREFAEICIGTRLGPAGSSAGPSHCSVAPNR
jgi:chemotaxis response regulator CheB